MALLKKKKDEVEEEEDEEVDEEEEGKLLKKKPIRRRAPKAKKEPPKPWGNKERLFLVFVLLATVGSSAVLGLSARNWKIAGIPRLDKLGLNPDFMERKVIIEGDNEYIKQQNKKDAIITELAKLTNKTSGVYGIYIKDLTSDLEVGLNEEEEFTAASLNKLPVMAALYIKSEKGEIDLEEVYKLKAEDKTGGSGVLYTKPVGFELTYRDLVKYMGQYSDNTAFRISRSVVGEAEVGGSMLEFKMENTSMEGNTTTPKDVGNFFERLNGELVLNKDDTRELLRYLTDTTYEEWITKGVPGNIVVSHKFGRETGVVNDAGIIYTDHPYVIVILTKGVVEKDANSLIPQISKMVYEKLS